MTTESNSGGNMKVLKIILIVLMFLCMIAGFVLVFGAKMFTGKNKDNASRKEMKLKIIGYVVFLCGFALALFQSLISF